MVSAQRAIFGSVAFTIIFAVVFAVLGGVGLGYWVWHNAPQIGGEYWWFIHKAVVILGTVFGLKVGAAVGYFVGMITGAIVGGLSG
jgi:uncharacterized membrane protein